MADIYGRHYGAVQELGLADSTDVEDICAKFKNLRETWDELCPGFPKWFN